MDRHALLEAGIKPDDPGEWVIQYRVARLLADYGAGRDLTRYAPTGFRALPRRKG